ncbi:MAG: T9SS type A sorting domain-containing protein [Paludibacter sp.]|nr:T9SS type A sorting domain-containing protein [Paludibacter sp.]
MNKLRILFLLAISFVNFSAFSQIKILFDNTKAEQAGNADWVISNSSSPVRVPTPAQSGITSSTAETYWSGGLSAWGVDCVKQGYYVETLPASGAITYGSTGNAQDLSNYNVFIVCEPNIQFTATEKTALMNFVKNGGGLFMVSDHTVSDRNSDGWDSPAIWNDFLTTNSVNSNNPFGISFDLANISQTSTNVATVANDSILHGKMGTAIKAMWSNGTTMTIDKTKNPTVQAYLYTTGSSTTGSTNVMFATAKFGNGKVAAIGDSSPCDDGTGGSGNTLYNGYTGDVGVNHEYLLMNATIWLASHAPKVVAAINELQEDKFEVEVFPNPVKDGRLTIRYTTKENAQVSAEILDLTGKTVRRFDMGNSDAGLQQKSFDVGNLKPGMYVCRVSGKNETNESKLVIIH